MHHLWAFLLTVYVLILIPGPSVLFIVGRGVALGRRAALVSVAGNSAGFVFQLALVAVGVGSLVASSEAVFTVVKLIGAGYLVLLGVRNIRERGLQAAMLREPGGAAAKPAAQVAREGFLVGATNPKGLLMFTAVLPQFIDPARGDVTAQLAVLGAIAIAIGMASDCAWALAAGSVREWLGRSSRRLSQLSAGGGLMLIGLGLGLAITGRRD